MDSSPWSYHEVRRHNSSPAALNIEELKYKLLCTTVELETCRSNTNEESRKTREIINQLIEIVKVMTWERDEAKQQLQLIQQQLTQPNFVQNYAQPWPHDSPVRQIRAGSSITESDNLSGTPNLRSYSSSPVDSFFNPVNSPEFSSMNMADSCNAVYQQQQQKTKIQEDNVVTSSTGESDPASALIDSLVLNKPLPVKGKLLQTVLEAGPLLQTLMLAGWLPEWCNPPPLQAFHIPPLAIKTLQFSEVVDLKPHNLTHRSNVQAEPLIPHPGLTGLIPSKRYMNASLFSSDADTGKRQRYD